MRRQSKKSISNQWLVNNEPLVVLGKHKNRDAPVICHRRDGPILETGPPVGTGSPEATGPPYMATGPNGTGPPRTGVG